MPKKGFREYLCGSFQVLGGRVVVASIKVNQTKSDIDLKVKWIEFCRTLEFALGFVKASPNKKMVPVQVVGVCITWIEFDCPLKLSFAADPVFLIVRIDETQSGVGLSQVIVQTQSFCSRGLGPQVGFAQRRRSINRSNVRESRIGQGIARVNVDRLVKINCGLFLAFYCLPAPEPPSF